MSSNQDSTSSLNETSQSHASLTMTKLLESGDFSELTITSGTLSFKVHRAIVCSLSKIPYHLIKDRTQGDTVGNINLTEDPEDAVDMMIKYSYKEIYVMGDKPRLLSHVQVFAIGDRYDIGGLKELATINYEDNLQLHWCDNDFIDCLRLCQTQGGDLHKAAVKFAGGRAPHPLSRQDFKILVIEGGVLALDINRFESQHSGSEL